MLFSSEVEKKPLRCKSDKSLEICRIDSYCRNITCLCQQFISAYKELTTYEHEVLLLFSSKLTAKTWWSGYCIILNPKEGVQTGTGMLYFAR